jgi:hypothetical protein
VQVYGAESVGARIEESRVVHLLATQNDTAGAGEALSGLQLHEAVAIVTTLLDKPISSDPARNHPLKLFLVQVGSCVMRPSHCINDLNAVDSPACVCAVRDQYGLSHLRSALSAAQVELFSKRELGLRALLELGADQQKLFEKLVDHPGTDPLPTPRERSH